MNDPFALLGVARRPWLEPDILKEKFLTLSAECHPDRVRGAPEKALAQEQFAALNSAYQHLLDPRERLLHLIEIESGERKFEVQSAPVELMDLFAKVGKAAREADTLLGEKDAESSPLLKVRLFERAQALIEELRAVQQSVNASRDKLLDEVRELDAGWEIIAETEKSTKLRRLNEIAGLLNYSKKWNAQLEEKILRLSF